MAPDIVIIDADLQRAILKIWEGPPGDEAMYSSYKLCNVWCSHTDRQSVSNDKLYIASYVFLFKVTCV